MIGATPFPISIDELTTETLTTALGASVLSFTAVRIGADRGMLGEIFLVTPTYASADASGAPVTVVCKFAALREEALASAQRGGTHEREVRCFDELLSGSPVAVPRFYAGWYDPDTAHFLLIQEAVIADTSIDQVAGIEPALTSLVVKEAARLHAAHWLDPTLADRTWLPGLADPRRINNLTTLARNGWAPLCDLLGADLSTDHKALGPGFPAQLEAALGALAELSSTLIHSDLRADNLLFSLDHRSVTLIDWQGAGVGPGSFDISYLLVHSLTIEDRRQHEKPLIAQYLSDLEDNSIRMSFDDFMAGYRHALHFGLAVACALPLIADTTQPRVQALARAMATRSLAALTDHDLLW